jgi:hypothetical protein
LFGEKEDKKKQRNMVVPSNKEGGGEVEVRGGGRTSCTLQSLQYIIEKQRYQKQNKFN